MAHPRPRRAARPTTSLRLARIAVPLALVGLGTSGVAAFGLSGRDAGTAVPSTSATTSAPSVDPGVREQPVSRDLVRTASPAPVPHATPTTRSARPKKAAHRAERPSKARPEKAKRAAPTADALAARAKASRTLWATGSLNVRTDPDRSAKVVTVVPRGTRLPATSVVRDGFRLVVLKGEGRWVTARYVSTRKPAPVKQAAKQAVKQAAKPAATATAAKKTAVASGGVTRASCGKGSAMERGLTSDAILVHRSVCARYPQVTSFGGTRGGGGFHASGQAVDCMISNATVGWQLARWLRAHARELGVSEVIYAQRIWTVQRSGEGWRPMADRGNATANHFDHVHVSVYGNRAG